MVNPMQCGPLTRSFDVVRAAASETDDNTIEVEFSSEEPVSRWFGVEILDHSPKAVRMGRLNNGAPFLLDHRSYSSDAQVGVVETASIDSKRGKATVRFSKAARAQEILTDIRDGIRRKISVGYSIHQFEVARGKDGAADTYRATDWEPFEVSLVPVPADDTVGVRSEDIFLARSASLTTTPKITIMDQETNEPEDTGSRNHPENPEQTPAPAQTRAPEQSPQTPPAPVVDHEAIRRAASMEADRRDEIRAIATHHKIDDKEVKRAISENMTPEQFRAFTLTELEKRNQPMDTPRESDNAPAEKGSRAHMLTAFATSAKAALGQRGVNIVIPSYAETQEFQRTYTDGGGPRFHRSLSGAPTLVDVVTSDAGIGRPIITETAISQTEVRQFPVDIITGAEVKLSVRGTAPTVTFRSANEGSDRIKGERFTRLYECQPLEHPIEVDITGILNTSKDPARFLEDEAKAVLEGTMRTIGRQTWYAGTTHTWADLKAPPGLLAQSETASTHVVDADGSTALTSVWVVQLGLDSLHHVYGGGRPLYVGDNWVETDSEDANGKKLRVLQNWVYGNFAPVAANLNRAIRIKKIGTDTGKGLTSALLAQAFRKAGELGFEPNAIFASYRSGEQFQTSLTAYHPEGKPVEWQEQYRGVPIYYTNNISNAEGAI